jgi:putative lipoprotein
MSMKHARLAACMTVCALACGRAEDPTPDEGIDAPDTVSAVDDTRPARPAVTVDRESFSYSCGGEYHFVAQMMGGGDSVRLLLTDTTLTLSRVVSASGARYGDGPYVYWSKAEEASLGTPDRSYTGCLSDEGGPGWQEAKRQGVRFRAIGQEPGWILDVHESDSISVLVDYGESRYRFPTVEPDMDRGAGRTVYRTESDANHITVVISDEPCRDAMSGWPYEATVRMTLNGREYQGCGRQL